MQTAVQCSSLLFLHFRAVCTSLVQSLQVGMKKRIQDFIAVYQLKNCESTATSYKTFLANLVASKNYPDFCLLIICKLSLSSLLFLLLLVAVSIRMNPLTPSQMTIFIVGKFVYITCHLLLPSLYMPLPLVVGQDIT